MLDLECLAQDSSPDTDLSGFMKGREDPTRSARLLAFLAGCADVMVRWRPSEPLTVRVRTGGDDIEIPWHLAERKKVFPQFAQALDHAIDGTAASGLEGTVRFADMLDGSASLRQAFDNLHGALVQRA